jgi:hypothetical protein
MSRMGFLAAILAVAAGTIVPGAVVAESLGATRTTVRTEQYPRPPYSGATYYIYERSGAVICIKLEVCNKYGNCSSSYYSGTYKAAEDLETGDPYDTSLPALISPEKMRKHKCLARYSLIET